MLTHAFLAIEQAHLTRHRTGDEDADQGKAHRPPPSDHTDRPWNTPDLLTETTFADLRNLIAEQIVATHHDREHSLRWFAWRLQHRT